MRNIRIADPRDRVISAPAVSTPVGSAHRRARRVAVAIPAILLVPALLLALLPALAAGPELSTTPSAASPGTKIAVRGDGFVPGTTGSLILDDMPAVLATYHVGGSGKFHLFVVIPRATAPGNHRLRAAREGSDEAVTGLEVTPAVVTLVPSPTSPLHRQATPKPTSTPVTTRTTTPTPVPPAATAVPTGAPTSTPPSAPTPVPAPAATPTPVTTPMASWSEDFSSGMGAFASFTHIYSSTFRVDASQCSVSGGVLNVTERSDGGGGYVSCMAVTSKSFDHGYFEARLRYPKGTGFDAAFWLRRPPSVPSPRSEIDIVEAYPNSPYLWPGPNRYQATMHYVAGSGLLNHQVTHDSGGSLADQWHVFAAQWLPGQRLAFYLDGVQTGVVTADVLSATTMNMVLSLGVGTWSAAADSSTPALATMQVDWVHWFDAKP